MDKPCVKILRLGRKSYTDALRIQNGLATKIKSQLESKSKPENTLIFVEHDPVYTIGIRTKNYGTDQQEKLEKLGNLFCSLCFLLDSIPMNLDSIEFFSHMPM